MQNKPELLAPAGTLEKLKWAAEFGADAVYFGAGYSLRSFAGNFDLPQVEEGINYLHQRGKKGYITLNIYPFTDEYQDICKLARKIDEMGADAFIVADIGVFFALKELGLKAGLHISTQANTMSAQTALAYASLGASRVNLARELSFQQIAELQKNVGRKIETEVFVHGAVCFSYSGRCAISDYLTGRRANRGECTHPCRWKYELVEEQRPGQYHPVFEDERGLYYFNSKDLALFRYIPKLAETGVNSFKIEGRMKSIHYIASTVSLYRRIIDGEQISEQDCMTLLNRVKNRGYMEGFIKGSVDENDYRIDENGACGDATFVGNVLDEKIENGSVFRVRNKIHAGETLEILTPDGHISNITLPTPLKTSWGGEVDFANNEENIVIPEALEPFTIIRRVNS
ncbi:MAG: U32 family peptidase [Sedimentisphaeraceae bacterium JB056]